MQKVFKHTAETGLVKLRNDSSCEWDDSKD